MLQKVLTEMLSHLKHQSAVTTGHLQGIENGRQALIELDVHHSSDHSHDASVGQGSLSGWGSVTPAWKDKFREKGQLDQG